METVFTRMLTAALLGIFIENAAFEHALGVNVLLYTARRKENLVGIFIGVIYVTTLTSMVTCLTDRYFSAWEYYNILMPFIYIFIMSAMAFFAVAVQKGKALRPPVGVQLRRAWCAVYPKQHRRHLCKLCGLRSGNGLGLSPGRLPAGRRLRPPELRRRPCVVQRNADNAYLCGSNLAGVECVLELDS